MVISFGKINNDLDTYLIELTLATVADDIDEKLKEGISWTKSVTPLFAKVFTVLAPYQYLGVFKIFDVFRNGKVVEAVSTRAISINMDIYEMHTKYSFGLDPLKIDYKPCPEFDQQYFAICYNPGINRTYIIPSTEIFRCCIGKYHSSVIEALFLDRELYNKEDSDEKNSLGQKNKYIRLGKYLPEEAAVPAYRHYSNPTFRLCYENTESHIRQKHYIYTQFPVKFKNKVAFRALKITNSMYFVPKLEYVGIENEDLKDLDYRLYNSAGIATNEETKTVPKSRISGKVVGNPTDLPVNHGPTNGTLPPAEVKNHENGDEEYSEKIKLREVREEYKKTITSDSKTLIQEPVTQGFEGFSGSNKSRIKQNYSTGRISFKNTVQELLDPLRALNYFTLVDYFLNQNRHSLTNDTTPLKANSWAYLAINFGEILIRDICVVELFVEDKRYYLIEIQAKNSEKFTMGIVAMQDFSYMHDVAFTELKREIIKNKGIFKNINNSQFVITSLKHYAERNKDKSQGNGDIEKNNRQMAENIMQKIKKLRGL